MIFPDTQDVAELKTGVKDTGCYSGLMTFTRKIGTAIAQSIVLIVLACVGYSECTEKIYNKELDAYPAKVTMAIRILFGIVVVVMISLAIWASLKYKVTDQKLTRIKYYLEKQRAGENDTLTDEEKAEKEALIKELG